MKVIIRAMNKQDLQWAREQANKEQWNPGLHDWASYYALDPNGHFVMVNSEFLEGEEQRIGCISAVRYKNFAFVGLYIVTPEHRGKGHGKALWEHAMQYIAEAPQQGLYAVPQQISRYKAQGFEGERVNRCFARKVPPISGDQCKEVIAFDATNPAFTKISDFDQELFVAPRSQLLRAMLTQDQTYGLAHIADEQIKGYCMIRPLHKGVRIGPLYANESDAAKSLMTEAMRVIGEGKDVVLNSSLENPYITMFAEFFELDIVEGADLTAMFKGGEPKKLMESRERRFAELSLEVG